MIGQANRVALVTGATEGIGRALAFALGRAGYAVGVTARSVDGVRAVTDSLRKEGYRAHGVPADVGEVGPCAEVVAQVSEALGPITCLVNNAGVARLGPIETLSLDAWDETMRTNIRSLFLMTRAVLPGMRERRQGDIVNMASLAGRNGFVGGTAYTASKHAVLGFSRSLLLETRKDGIRVIAVCPGSVDTPLLRNQSVLHPNFDQALQPTDVAEAVLHTLGLPRRATISELDIRPSNP